MYKRNLIKIAGVKLRCADEKKLILRQMNVVDVQATFDIGSDFMDDLHVAHIHVCLLLYDIGVKLVKLRIMCVFESTMSHAAPSCVHGLYMPQAAGSFGDCQSSCPFNVTLVTSRQSIMRRPWRQWHLNMQAEAWLRYALLLDFVYKMYVHSCIKWNGSRQMYASV